MSAQSSAIPQVNSISQKSLDSVQSILTELLDLSSEISHLKEELIAKGVPFNTVNALVDLARSGPRQEYESLRGTALRLADEGSGVGSISSDELDTLLNDVVLLDDDLIHVRKMARGHEINPQAINLLTQIVRQNPGDGGQLVLNSMVEYARAYGISVGGVKLVTDSESAAPKSVLPDIQLPDRSGGPILKHRDLIIELSLGVLVAITALSLLT